MIELKKSVSRGLREALALEVYLPSQEIGGLYFPLLTLEITQTDNGQSLNHGIISYNVTFDVYLYADKADYILTHEHLIKEYFNALGIRLNYESQVSKSHHWYKQYQFTCRMQVKNENYIIL